MALDFSCTDWVEKLERRETPIADIPVDEARAGQAVGLFNSLRVPDIPGQPRFGEVGGQWFRDIVRACFGAFDPETDARLVGELFVLVPKKNGKTTMSSALGLLWLCLNLTPNVDGIIVGPTKEISEKCFEQARGMIEADPTLRKILHVRDHKRTIEHRITKAKLRIKTFDMKVVTGSIPALVILDELHVISKNRDATKILGQIRGGMITNNQSLLVMITTQSTEPPAGVFKAELKYARAVRDAEITEGVRTLPVIYEFPEAMQLDDTKPWRDPRVWYMVLPSLGQSVHLQDLQDLYAADQAKGKEQEALWVSQHLNIQIGTGLHSDGWVGAVYWKGAENADLSSLEAVLDRSEVAVMGFDGGGLDDLAGLCVIGRDSVTRRWLSWSHAWAHTDVFARRQEIAERLRDFQADGHLTVIEPGEVLRDFADVAHYATMIQERGLLAKENAVGLDPNGVADLVDMLEAARIKPEQITGVPQGWHLASAIWGLERKLKDRTLQHGGTPMMEWVLGNARAVQRGNNIYVTKEAAGKAKIDPLTALFNAAQLMSRNPAARAGGALLGMAKAV